MTESDIVRIGIDLGTTVVVVATTEGEVPKVCQQFPAIVNLSTNKVGEKAKIDGKPQDIIYEAKKYMGATAVEAATITKEAHHPYKMDGNMFVGTDKTKTRPEELSAALLKEVKANFPGKQVEAIITVPAYFKDAQRQATKDAAELAGIKVHELLNEPTAATLTYTDLVPSGAKILTCDVGGGTLDISAITKTDNKLKVEATSGDPHMGGRQIDRMLANWALKKTKKKTTTVTAKMLEDCNRAKHLLTTQDQTEIQILGEKVKISLVEFERLVRPFLTRINTYIDNTLELAEWTRKDVDIVILAGGTSRVRVLREIVAEELPEASIMNGVDEDEAIALGAAHRLRALTAPPEATGIVMVTEIAGETIGVGTLGDVFSPILWKNTPLPATRTLPYKTSADFQSQVLIEVKAGDDCWASNNRLLGVFHMEVLPMPRGELTVFVTFKMSVDNILTVVATEDGGLRRKKTVCIKKTGDRNLTKEEMSICLAKAEKAAAQEIS
ncbi:uncharacterized protein LOC134815383 [Bolinopsis microptera]|uniref:uncharacterized protein LOC134815383 n=1 Tax=Bolinopsis microptera TaxID=2820187 RepID=UPI003078BECE